MSDKDVHVVAILRIVIIMYAITFKEFSFVNL
jgi:hypothetical protein